MLALNMMDIARKRGMEIDASRLARELGVPVVQVAVVRRGGTEALHCCRDRSPADGAPAASAADWRTPTPANCGSASAKPTAFCAPRSRARVSVIAPRRWPIRCCCIRSPDLAVLLAILFVMFQAVFAWARPLMDAIQAGFAFLGALVETWPLPDLLRSFLKDGLISGVGSVIVFPPQIVILFSSSSCWRTSATWRVRPS